MVAKAFALINIRYMDFDERDRHAGQRIAQRHARVRVSSRVDHEAVHALRGLLHEAHQLALVVGLPDLDLQAELRTPVAAQVDEVAVRRTWPGTLTVDVVLGVPVEVALRQDHERMEADLNRLREIADAVVNPQYHDPSHSSWLVRERPGNVASSTPPGLRIRCSVRMAAGVS